MEREPGYYWVRTDKSQPVWLIGYWCGEGYWSLPGDGYGYYDNEIDEVDEKQIPEKQ